MIDNNVLFYGQHNLECADGSDPLVVEKQIAYVGTFKKWNGDKVVWEAAIDEDLIDHWVKTHSELIEHGLDVPLPVGHTDDPEKRRGTVLKLYKKLDAKNRVSLYASMKFNDEKAKEQFKSSNVSLYCPPVYRSQDKVFVRPIRHVCITDYPVINDLEPFTIAAAYETKPKEQSAMMKALAAKLGLEVPPDASDEAIAGMIFAKFEELMKEDVDGDGKVGEGDPPKDAPVDASNNPMMLNLVRDNRIMKIEKLVAEHKIAPARAKALKDKFAGSTIDASSGVFDSLYEELSQNEPIMALSQSGSGRQLHGGNKGQKSALVANAEKMAGK